MDDEDDQNDHIFDKDPVLEYLFFQEVSKEEKKKDGGKSGCSVVFLVFGSSIALAVWGIAGFLC